MNGHEKLYHATKQYHESIDLNHSRDYLDFGKGYYLTSSLEQAARWITYRNNSCDNNEGWIFEYNILHIGSEIKCLPLLECNMDWLDVILYFRTGTALPNKTKWENIESYDIIFDRMADGRISNLISQYMNDKISKTELLDKAKGWRDQDQYCFKTEKAIKLLVRQKEYHWTGDEGVDCDEKK